MPVPTLDDDCSTAYDALERLVTASVQVITYLDNLTDDLPEGADAVRAFRDSHPGSAVGGQTGSRNSRVD